jgi:hypothetical protein
MIVSDPGEQEILDPAKWSAISPSPSTRSTLCLKWLRMLRSRTINGVLDRSVLVPARS